MVIKGFIDYNSGKIPFVLQKYSLELFGADELIKTFIKEHTLRRSIGISLNMTGIR